MSKFPMLLLLASAGLAQTAKPKPAPKPLPPLGDTKTWTTGITRASIAFLGDPHCGWLGTWDVGNQVCAITITFSGATDSLTCSPVSSADGTHRMICWYKPERKEESHE